MPKIPDEVIPLGICIGARVKLVRRIRSAYGMPGVHTIVAIQWDRGASSAKITIEGPNGRWNGFREEDLIPA